MRKILSLLILVLPLANCDDQRLGEALITADSLLVEDADSALHVVYAIPKWTPGKQNG
ncbi:MAG: hypothetical protein J6Z14_10280 [Prevotella sp.]|nr:hypothetical protein [Prevotella sp.]